MLRHERAISGWPWLLPALATGIGGTLLAVHLLLLR